MKPFHILLGIILVSGCKPAAKEETIVAASPSPEGDRVSIPFAGDWLNQAYYDLILRKKSPHDAQEKVENCFISIPATTRDTTVMIYGWHESGPELVAVRNNDQFELWEVQGDSLDRLAFRPKVIDENHLQLGNDTFVRIHPFHGPYDQPFILEEILFKGTYTLDNGDKVEFKNTGEFSGIGRNTYYRVRIDYLDAGLQVDQVGIGTSEDNLDYFGFKYKGDVLQLYVLKCKEYNQADQRCDEVDFGKLAYTLKKQP